jgi:hypothetical protein
VDPIRSNPFPTPVAAPQGSGADAARLAAQKAFFAAALGQSATAAAPQATPAPQAAQAARAAFFAPSPPPAPRPEIRPDPTAEPPTRILRPGSLLDIRV